MNLRLYKDYISWLATVPKTGNITTEFPVRDSRPPFQRRLDMPIPLEKDDIRLVRVLQTRFMSHPQIWNDPSIDSQIRTLNEYVEFYQMNSQEAKLKSVVRKRDKLVSKSKGYSKQQMEETPLRFKNTGVYRLYVKVGGVPYEIGHHYHASIIVGANCKTFKTFNEMGAEIVNGKPKFIVSYKGTFHELKGC